MPIWLVKKMIPNLCRTIQTNSWIFFSIISLCFSQMVNIWWTILLYKLDIYWITSSSIIKLPFLKCQWFNFRLYLFNMMKFLRNWKKNQKCYSQSSNLWVKRWAPYMNPHPTPWRVTQFHYWWTFRLVSYLKFQK